MVAMVVEKMSVEKMFKKMKEKAKKAAEPLKPENGSDPGEDSEPLENSKSKKKKKKKEQEVAELEMEEAATAPSSGGVDVDDESVERTHKRKRMKKKVELDFSAAMPSNGGAPLVDESVDKFSKEKILKKKKKKGPEVEYSEIATRNAGTSTDEPVSAELKPSEDEDKEKKKKRELKERDEKRKLEKKLKKEKNRQKRNAKKNVKETKHSDRNLSTSEAREPSSSDVAEVGVDSVPEPVGLQIYWNLSSVDASVREAASVALVRELVVAQKNYEDRGLGQEEKAAEALILGEAKIEEDGLKDCAPAVQYALRRLIRGVASSRESARQGFALALASVLGALPSINGAPILKMVEKHLEVTASMKGQEARDSLLGQLFAFAALIRSSRVIGAATTIDEQELAKEVTERLLALAKKKTFLQEATACVLVELGQKLEGSELLNSVFASPQFSENLEGGAGSISPDTLFVALSLHRKLPKSAFQSCTVIPGSGNLIDIFEKDNLLRLLPCLKESTSSHPRVHLVWEPLLQILFSDDVHPTPSKKKKRSTATGANLATRLGTFWSTVVDGSLLTSSHERKHLAMQLLLMFLPRLPAPLYVQYMLSSNFIQCLLGARASQENLLFKSAQNCIDELCKWAGGDDESRIRVVIAFQQSSQGKFDHCTKTKAVKDLLSGITAITGYQLAFQALARLYLSEESLEGDSLVKSSVSSKKQKVPIEDTEGEGVKDVKRDPAQRRWAVDQLRALCQQALSSLPPNVVIEELVVKFVPSLTPIQPVTEEEEESIATLQLTMLQLSSAIEPGERKDKLQAMLSLLVQLLFESRLVPTVAVEIASEITICCKKAFGDLVELEVESREEGEEEPAFMDVLVDVLLSLLAQPSAPIRAAAEQVFKSFSGDLTSSGLTDLLRIVKKDTQRARHKPVVDLDTGKDDDDDDILDVEESDADSGDEDIEDDDENDDSDDDEDDTKVEASKEHIKAPGKRKPDTSVAVEDEDGDNEAADEGEGVEEETSDLDDEAMFRMDKHLANIMKQRKQGDGTGTDDSKDAHTQLMHFKFRVLGLLDFFLQKHSGSLLVLTILPSMLHVFVNSCATDGNSQMADRVSSILQSKLFKGKQYPKGPEVDQASLKVLLKKALKLASRSTVKKVTAVAQGTCHWILKVIHGNLKEEKDDDAEEMYSAALEDFYMHRKCRLPSAFFRETFVRNQWLGNCLLGAVLDKCTNARSQYLQFESLQLAGTILGFKNGKFVHRSKQPDASLDTILPMAEILEPHVPSLSRVIVHLLNSAAAAKGARRSEAIQFCVSTLELLQNLYPSKYLAEFVNSDSSVASLGEIMTPGKSKLNNLVERVQQLLETK